MITNILQKKIISNFKLKVKIRKTKNASSYNGKDCKNIIIITYLICVGTS